MENNEINEKNEDKEVQVQARGCFQLVDLLLFAFGAFIMFGKTANLLGKLAPDDWFGLTPADYGFAAALLIEGYLVVQKIKSWLIRPANFMEWATDIVVTFIPFILSVFAQAADGWFTTGLIQSMTQAQKMQTTTFVSVLITVPVLLQIVQTAINNAPKGVFDNIKRTANAENGGLGFLRGLGRIAESVGKRFNRTSRVGKAVYAKDTSAPAKVVKTKKAEDETYPTNGAR